MKKNISRKLNLNKTTISSLSERELQMIKGGEELWGTRAMCLTSTADNCTDSSCKAGDGEIVIICLPL